jgi:hypothetical protein
MAIATIIFGSILIAVGLIAFSATSYASMTALIPSIMGLIMVLLGLVARAIPDAARGALISAVVIAVLAILGSMRGVVPFVALLRGEDVVRPVAVVAQSTTLLLAVIYLIVLAVLRSRGRATTS